MGRKPSSSKHADTLHKDGNVNPSVEGLVEPENSYPSGKVDIQTERVYPTLERVELQEANKTSSITTVLNKTPAGVRRSLRLQNTNTKTVMSTETQNIERIFAEITVSESEEEDDPADDTLPEHNPNPTLDEKTLNAKINYILQLLKAQKMEMDALTSRVMGKSMYNEGSGMGDITYKSLYIESQKKVEALMAENNQLNGKLENALGKIEVYEKGILVTSEVLEKLKDMFFCSSLTRATEAAINVISGEIRHAAEAAAAAEIDRGCKSSSKRKRSDKVTKET